MEKHHIRPKSEGGSDDETNLVNLTAREHYVAHLLLAKIYDDHKMWSAVIYMRTGHKERQEFRFNSRLYESARLRFAKYQSEFASKQKWTESQYRKMRGRPAHNKGIPCSEEQKRKISATLKGRPLSEETKAKMKGRPSPRKGCHLSEEQKRKIAETLRGRKLPEKVKEKLRNRVFTQEYRDKMSRIKKGHPTSDEKKRKIGLANKGKTYWNNGEVEVRRRECPEGFVKGRLKRNGN